MKKNKLPKGPYKPQQIEEEILDFWNDKEFFKPEYHPKKGVQNIQDLKKDDREAFCIINPPPNANGRPHIGHMSGYAYQDLMARHARLEGKKVAMLPGKDHAGIQTEAVFERDVLKPKGKTKFDLGREAFYKATYKFTQEASRWAREDEKRIGLSSDFSRDTFTLDSQIVHIVLDTFIKMVDDGMVYKGVRIINWCPSCKTALADVDTEKKERESKLYYIHYPIVQKTGAYEKGRKRINNSNTDFQRIWRLSFYDRGIIDSINNGYKKVETRALNPEEPERYFGDIKDGDFIVIVDKNNHEESFLKIARNIRTYKDIESLLNTEDLHLIFPGKKFENIKDLKKEWEKLAPGYVSKLEKNGIIAFDIEEAVFEFEDEINLVFQKTDERKIRDYSSLLESIDFKVDSSDIGNNIGDELSLSEKDIVSEIIETSKTIKDKFIISISEDIEIPYIGEDWRKNIKKHSKDNSRESVKYILNKMRNAKDEERKIFLKESIAVAYNGQIIFETSLKIEGLLLDNLSETDSKSFKEYIGDIFYIEDLQKYLGELNDEELESLFKDKRQKEISKLYDSLFAYKNKVITVATTRPETMLGDTAVVVNSDDPRYQFLDIDRNAILLPIANREIPLITSPRVEIDFGTGALKLTPAHATEDYTIMQEWNSENKTRKIDYLNVIYKDNRMHGPVGKYFGKAVEQVRKEILSDLEDELLLEKTGDLEQTVSVCERCKSVIEPLMSSQWYVDTERLKGPAIDAVRSGKIKIHPQYMEKKYLYWMENLREWPISRSLWWGYRFPVWYKGEKTEWVDPEGKVREKIGNYEVKNEDNLQVLINKGYIYIGLDKPEGEDWVQDENVFDTWFSSGQWAYAPLIKYNLLDTFYPTSVMETMYDILEFWVSRMIMLGIYHEGDIPFEHVYLHGMVLAPDGQKMSKSKGNQITPDEIIDEYGADALRLFYFTRGKAGGQYAVDYDNLLGNRKFLNKIWNSAKFVMMNLDNLEEGTDLFSDKSSFILTEVDKNLIKELEVLSKDTKRRMNSFNFQVASSTLYDSYWHIFCDKYLEDVKARLYTKDRKGNPLDYDKELRASAQWMTYHSLDTYLKLLHPFIPFITEKVWHMLGDIISDNRAKKSIVWAGYNY